jgi:hypothetical protein
MTDRIIAYTVTLIREIRDDDAEAITNAIRMIKGVANVVPVVSDPNTYWAKDTARLELGKQLWAVLYPEQAEARKKAGL